MSNLSSAGARDRGHQVGCPCMRDASATCACPRPVGADIADFGTETAPWYAWVLATIAVLAACGFIYLVTLGAPR